MLRRIILILTLILISAAATSLVAVAAVFLAGGLTDRGAAATFRWIAVAGLFVVAVDLCLLVLATAICLIEQSNDSQDSPKGNQGKPQ